MGRLRISMALVAVALSVAACGGDDSSEGTDAGISLDQAIGASGTSSRAGGGATSDEGASVAKSAFAAMQVPKDELDSAAQSVVDLATSPQVGGFLVSSIFDTQERHGSAHVLVKVPAPRFEGVVAQLGNIGEITRQELEGQDMTPEVLQAHAALQRARARTAALIERLDGVEGDAARFQLRERLREARTELRSKRQDANFMSPEVEFSSVEVALRATPPPPPPDKPAVERALATARSLTLGIASAAVLIAGAVIPILGLLVVVYLIGAPIVRRLKPRLQSWPG